MPVTHRVDDFVATRPNWKIAHVEVRCVCRGCNSGWMGSIEGRVKPLLVQFVKGNTVRLDASQQLELSAWAALKAFVYEQAAHHLTVLTQEERDLLMTQVRAPANVRVILAALDEGNHFIVQRKVVAGWRTQESPDLEYAYATTFVVGHLVVQIVGSPTSPHEAFKQTSMVRPRWQTITPPVLPEAMWPGPELLTQDTLDEFVNLFVPTVEEKLDPKTFPTPPP